METCNVEGGLFRKKPCGHAAVAKCLNCEQPLCLQHAVAEMNDAGKKSGKFMCQECVAAAREHDKSMSTVARSDKEKKAAALTKSFGEPPAVVAKKPVIPAQAAPATGAPAQKVETQPEVIEFTPKDGKLEYTRKKDDPGHKP